MQNFTLISVLFAWLCTHGARAQDLMIAHDDSVWVYDTRTQQRTTAQATNARQSIALPSRPSLDRVAHYADEVSRKLRPTAGYDFFQGLQSPHDPTLWVYLERQQIGAGYRLVRFDQAKHQPSVLIETDNPQRAELAYKPIAWTEQADEIYVEGLFLDQAEEHEGIWRLSLSTGAMRLVPMPTPYLRTPLLSPDRQKFIVTGTLEDQVDWLHGITDVVYELNLTDGTRQTVAHQPGTSLEVQGWAHQTTAQRTTRRSLRTSALDYYLPWDAGVELCVSRHGTPAPTGNHNFVGRCDRFGPGGHHGYAAVDFATSLSSDQNVRAAAAGTVSFAGISGSLTSGYGRLVILLHSDGTRTYYAHNKSILVSTGQAVARGQVIAREGTTGGSTGDHIHFEWRAAGGSASVKGSFAGIGEPRQDYRYRSNNTTAPADTEAPTSTISAPGGNTFSGDFTVNFADNDNVGVTQRFYQVLERYGDHWYANRGNGFFNDNFKELYTGYTQGTGNWTISNEHLRQADAVATNTALTTSLSQASGQPYLYSFAARMLSTTGPRKFGVHIMADSPTLSQRGNSYLVWFSAEQNQLIIYKTINNTLYTQTSASVAVDDQWANYKITYNPANGALEVFRNDQSLLKWTDNNPLKTGNYLSLRTNATAVAFDDLKVYKARSGSVTVTAGDAVTDDLRTAQAKIKSLASDAAGNWSLPGNLDLTRTSTARQVSLSDDLTVYPNPTDGGSLTLRYRAEGSQPTQVQVLDVLGRTVGLLQDSPPHKQVRQVDLRSLFQDLSTGRYLVRLQQGRRVQARWVNKQ